MKNEANVQALELKKLMMAEQKDYKKIKAALTRMSDINHDTLIAGLKAKDDVMIVLTPEQQETLKSLAKERPGDRGLFREGRPGRQRPMRDRMPGVFPRIRPHAEDANPGKDI
jgi:Spy/CpxP family protein refolding chaperone